MAERSKITDLRDKPSAKKPPTPEAGQRRRASGAYLPTPATDRGADPMEAMGGGSERERLGLLQERERQQRSHWLVLHLTPRRLEA